MSPTRRIRESKIRDLKRMALNATEAKHSSPGYRYRRGALGLEYYGPALDAGSVKQEMDRCVAGQVVLGDTKATTFGPVTDPRTDPLYR